MINLSELMMSGRKLLLALFCCSQVLPQLNSYAEELSAVRFNLNELSANIPELEKTDDPFLIGEQSVSEKLKSRELLAYLVAIADKSVPTSAPQSLSAKLKIKTENSRYVANFQSRVAQAYLLAPERQQVRQILRINQVDSSQALSLLNFRFRAERYDQFWFKKAESDRLAKALPVRFSGIARFQLISEQLFFDEVFLANPAGTGFTEVLQKFITVSLPYLADAVQSDPAADGSSENCQDYQTNKVVELAVALRETELQQVVLASRYPDKQLNIRQVRYLYPDGLTFIRADYDADNDLLSVLVNYRSAAENLPVFSRKFFPSAPAQTITTEIKSLQICWGPDAGEPAAEFDPGSF